MKNTHARVMVLVHDTSSQCALQMYEVSLKYLLVLCRLSPAIENLSPWLKIADNRLKLFTIDCQNSVMVPSFSVTFGSFAVG